ncbi:hypothetical protein AYO21_09202 [Fonsecaea monophora]|uniref:Uncharacterized protein n=1 Tax=Fonsecaea monophora TaxID=254056 RepID=A0A177F010_9EURO|nr:hypothetical protein AYO21_09202 [Fonsecaea monophora]OAG36642.1 hypothetical protein AYO21_09202 [Fonsecaea monophora]
MASPRHFQPPPANEIEFLDPRLISNAAPTPATSQASAVIGPTQGDAVDEEFAHLSALLQNDLNDNIQPDFSFTEFLESTADDFHGFAATDNIDHGFDLAGNGFHDLAGSVAATGHMTADLPSLNLDTTFVGFDAFFDLEGASGPVSTGVAGDRDLNAVGTQFDNFSNMHRNDANDANGLNSTSWQNGNLTRDFVMGAAVDLPVLGAVNPVPQIVENNSLSAPHVPFTPRPRLSEYRFINRVNDFVKAAEEVRNMGKDTADLSPGLGGRPKLPVLKPKPVVRSDKDVLTRVSQNDGLVRTTMDTPALPAVSRAIKAGPGNIPTNDDEENVETPRVRKRKLDDANADTESGNGDNESPAPLKKLKKHQGYGPRVDTSMPATTSAAGPFLTRSGQRTQDQGALQQSNQDADAPKWTRRLPSLLDCTDPYMCPGPNLNCFHAFQNTSGYFLHVENVHGVSRAKMNREEFRHLRDVYEPHPESWWIAKGQDTTYQGTDRKQINARRRMRAGIRSNDPNYVEEVYVRTPAVRSAGYKKPARR